MVIFGLGMIGTFDAADMVRDEAKFGCFYLVPQAL
jgi:hypothetical protein